VKLQSGARVIFGLSVLVLLELFLHNVQRLSLSEHDGHCESRLGSGDGSEDELLRPLCNKG
jgi:hypothetical protein